MVKKRSVVITEIKMKLIKEAGMKCANPGCINYRTHIHHIMEWAIYQTHDEAHMIAICPSCHDEVHNGKLGISDDILYSWKSELRMKLNRDQIYVEPATDFKLLLGSIAFQVSECLSVFKLSDSNKLSFRLEDKDIFLANLNVTTIDGKNVIKVIENNVKYEIEEHLKYYRRTGKITVRAPFTQEFLPQWAMKQMEYQQPQFGRNNELTLLDIEVLKPGVVKVEGIWVNNNYIIIITKNSLSFLRPGLREPISLLGEGENTIIKYTGDITKELFGFEG